MYLNCIEPDKDLLTYVLVYFLELFLNKLELYLNKILSFFSLNLVVLICLVPLARLY